MPQPSFGKDALIIDERYNSGGFIPDFYVEKLGRKLLSIGTPRSTAASTRILSSPSPMTRITGSVPDGLITSRPWPLRRCSAFSMAEAA